MTLRVALYVRSHSGSPQTAELLCDLRQDVERRGGVIVASHSDDGRIVGRGKYSGWRTLLTNLEWVDQVVVGSAGDLPGQKVQDLFKILDLFRHHGVGLYLVHDGINTGAGSAAVLDLISAYCRAKLSEAIKFGQTGARTRGKVIGRPRVPDPIRRRILHALSNGYGIRITARTFGVSPGSVLNIKRMHRVEREKMAA